jgi:16S rRNA (guanine(966)-N(2))-methyltransferase RsmD
MRIITGTLKNRRITVPKGVVTRPTTDRTKESMFNIIESRKGIEDCTILDLFSGSGNLAFEAISRGASKAVCVEQNRKCAASIEQNAQVFDIKTQIRVLTSDVWGFVNGLATSYDLVFADPPYDYPYMGDLVDIVIQKGWLKEDGWFILEHDARHNFSQHPHCVFAKPYGRTVVSIFLTHQVFETNEEMMQDEE